MSQKATILVKKAARLGKQLSEVLEELALITDESRIQAPHTTKPDFDADELRADFEKLRLAVEQGSEAQDVIGNFMAANNKERLNAFIRVNGLPILSNDSNVSVTRQLVQLLRQSKAIGAPVKSLGRNTEDN
jgi:hypothetical protein